MSKGRSFNAVVIGLGSIARRIYLPMFAENRRLQLIGVLAKHHANAVEMTRHYQLGQAFATLDELIAVHPEIAFVFTPKETHYEIVSRLLKEGIHVYCEKPMALTLRQAEELVELSKKFQRVLMIGFNRRFAPVYVRAYAITKESRIDVCFAEKNRPQTEYRATLENAIHMVDLLRWFCGEAEEVSAFGQFNTLG